MNATLRDRLILVEQLFLIAVVAQDETVRKEFSLELSQLVHHFKAIEASGDLDDNTILLLSRLSQVITATTQCMLECEDALSDAQNALTSCSSLPLLPDDPLPVSTSRLAFPSYLLFSHVSPSGTLGILGHNKLLDACAYRWLMQNMHNPYPTSTRLQIIGDESMTSVTQAELWFQEARDSIGWTKLSDEFFTGSLNATIIAARRVYLEHDNTIPFCIALAFSKVKAFMETLFAEHPASRTPSASHVGSAQAVPADSTHVNDLLDEEEIEDTTPPPPVAGCKRNFPEDTATSAATDLHRPLKRLRARFLHQVHPHLESMHPLSNTCSSFEKSVTESLTYTSPIPVTSVRLSDPSFPVGSKPSPNTLTFNSTGQRQTDLNGVALEMVAVSPDPPILQGEMRNQQISEGSPLVPPEQQLSPAFNHGWHPSPGFASTFEWPVPPPLFHLPPDLTGASQITANPGASVDLRVYDWKSISNPLAETAMPTNQPASVYVPSSDLAALNFELPDPLYLHQSAEMGYTPPCPLGDLGSLEDFSLLQFPIPTTFPPDVPVFPSAPFCSDNSTFTSSEMDWSMSDFVNQFASFSAESLSAPSPSAVTDATPITPENTICSLLPPLPHEVDKPISVLGPSIPPSVFLPAESGIFTDDASSMWSLWCGLS